MKRIITTLLSLLCLLALHAQIKGEEIRVIVTPNHSDWTYQLGETATFTVRVLKSECLLPGVTIDYEVGPEMYPNDTKKDITLKDGTYTIKSKLVKPGFIRCDVKAHVGNRTYEGRAAAAYAPEQIQATTVNPSDFDSFWSSTLEEARKVPLSPTLELLPERCTDKVNVYQVSFQNIREGSRTYGILCIPKAEGQYPALLRVPGAGIRPYYGDISTAERGAITLEIGIHGIPVTMTQDYYDKLFAGALNCYWNVNLDDRYQNYYRRVFVGTVRAVDYICSLPQYNGKALGVTGSSQGGCLSFVTAALDQRVTCLAAVHPALCDHTAFLEGHAGGWPHYFFWNKNPRKTEIEASRYYDTVNFARRVSQPGWYSWGYNDNVCPPTSMYAAYNSVTAPKELHPYLETAHFWYQEQWDEWTEWLYKQLGI